MPDRPDEVVRPDGDPYGWAAAAPDERVTLEQHGRVIDALADEETRRKGAEAEAKRLHETLKQIATAQAELRAIKSVRNTRRAMDLVTRIGRLARS